VRDRALAALKEEKPSLLLVALHFRGFPGPRVKTTVSAMIGGALMAHLAAQNFVLLRGSSILGGLACPALLI
jgi:hypothetical protein